MFTLQCDFNGVVLAHSFNRNLLNSSDRLDTVLSILDTTANKKIGTPTHLGSLLTCEEEDRETGGTLVSSRTWFLLEVVSMM